MREAGVGGRTEKLNLGCGRKVLPGWVNLDAVPGPGVDCVHDLNEGTLPFGDETFTIVRAHHVFEHLPRYERLVPECARVLRPGGVLDVVVPLFPTAAGLPWHVRFFFEDTFDYFCRNARARALDLMWREVREVDVSTLEWTPIFRMVHKEVLRYYPFSWHVAKYLLGPAAYRLPIPTRTRHLHVVMEMPSEECGRW